MDLSPHALVVYIALRRYYNAAEPDKPVQASNETIAAKTKMSLTMVKRGIKELVAKKIITRKMRYKTSCDTHILI